MSNVKILQNMDFGEILRAYRKAKGYTQQDLIKKMEIYGSTLSANNYSKIERGQRNIFIEDFIILKLVLNFDYNDFFREFEKIIRARLED